MHDIMKTTSRCPWPRLLSLALKTASDIPDPARWRAIDQVVDAVNRRNDRVDTLAVILEALWDLDAIPAATIAAWGTTNLKEWNLLFGKHAPWNVWRDVLRDAATVSKSA